MTSNTMNINIIYIDINITFIVISYHTNQTYLKYLKSQCQQAFAAVPSHETVKQTICQMGVCTNDHKCSCIMSLRDASSA